MSGGCYPRGEEERKPKIWEDDTFIFRCRLTKFNQKGNILELARL